ncbi:MFS transporter [Domibacillus enclensis]|uniref:MFS transporter n=1 Tax=Domibacillus enclensis TaxID=1017273 RepID=A0A1N7A5Z2_9BACI|nr:MFS transporter [Domibacillus enclensis]OXS75707.1 MFS transporter [Domibacillus enclensis]SIR34448.1 Predicted arabinose efflux permease, MFS family [Domibacillus enclensis]
MRAFVYLIVFFSFFDLFTQLPIMSPFAESLGATPFLTGLVVGMYSFSNTIGNVLSGFWTDRKGPFLVLLTGLFTTGAALLLYQAVSDAWSLLLVRFVHGLLAGLITPAAFTYLANHTANEQKGKGAAISGAFVGMAAIVGPAFSGIMSSRTSEAAVLGVTAAAMLLLGTLAFLLLKKQPAPAAHNRSLPPPLRELFRNTGVLKAFTGAFLLMFSQGVLAYMLPLKVTRLGFDAQTSGLLLSTFGVVAILVFLSPLNRLFDRLSPDVTFSFGISTMGVSLLLISQAEADIFLYSVMGLYGVGFAFLFPSINSLLINTVSPDVRGRAYGYFYAFFSLGVVAGSTVTGGLALEPSQGLLLTGLLLCGAGLLVILLHAKKASVR